jgi:methylphosphotriester-DNA--protein-cysteine methyltransferase
MTHWRHDVVCRLLREVRNHYRDGNTVLTRIPQMDWRSASPVHQFRWVDQAVTLDQVAESWRTRRVKEGISGSASVSEAFGRVGRIQMGNPGLDDASTLVSGPSGEIADRGE